MVKDKDSFTFDRKINVGNLLAFGAVVFAAFAAHYAMASQVSKNTQEIDFNAQRLEESTNRWEKQLAEEKQARKDDRTEIIGLLKTIADRMK